MTDTPPDPAKAALLRAIVPHVAFDGWSETAFNAAVSDAGLTQEAAKAACPRGALDLAIAFQREGDREMVAAVSQADLSAMKFREKVAYAVRARLAAVPDKEVVRRGSTLFALPQHAGEGARLVWGTADAIWTALGDDSRDVNWYTKRATLSAVYAATVLYWLGDETPQGQGTAAFLDRRIEDVMAFEALKANVNNNPLLKPLLAPLNGMLGAVQAPEPAPRAGYPGHWTPET